MFSRISGSRCLFIALFCLVVIVSSGTMASARLRLGLNVGRSMGGDIEKSETVIGSQFEVDLQDGFGLELSSSTFSDEYAEGGIEIKQDLLTWGVSLTYRTPTKPVQGLFLAGVNFNVPKITAQIDPAAFGTSATAIIDADSSFGTHLGAGVSVPLADHWELFGLYTYSFLKLEADMTVYMPGSTVSDKISGDYDHGLLKIGFNYLF